MSKTSKQQNVEILNPSKKNHSSKKFCFLLMLYFTSCPFDVVAFQCFVFQCFGIWLLSFDVLFFDSLFLNTCFFCHFMKCIRLRVALEICTCCLTYWLRHKTYWLSNVKLGWDNKMSNAKTSEWQNVKKRQRRKDKTSKRELEGSNLPGWGKKFQKTKRRKTWRRMSKLREGQNVKLFILSK